MTEQTRSHGNFERHVWNEQLLFQTQHTHSCGSLTMETTKIILMFYDEGTSIRTPARKKETSLEITSGDNDVKKLKERIR